MRKLVIAAAAGVAAMSMMSVSPALAASYADDRAEIENLMYQYVFAMDWRDSAAYAAVFTEDGTLESGGGAQKGRAAIAGMIEGMKKREADQRAKDPAAPRRGPNRHFINNLVLTVNGNKATGRAYWMSVSNTEGRSKPVITGYGHYEDTLERRNGKWLFTSRKILNEGVENRAAGSQNPTRP
jgi:hypothetical protein